MSCTSTISAYHPGLRQGVFLFLTHAEFRRHRLKTAQNVQCKRVFDAEVTRKQVKGPFVTRRWLLFYTCTEMNHALSQTRDI